MESTKRLREWLKGRLLLGNGWNELNEIASAIEREAMEERTAAYNEGYDAGFASAADWSATCAEGWAAQHEDAMAEHGWVRLPVDADGVPIHIGDVMEWPDGSTAEVVGIGDGTFFYVEEDEDAADWSSTSDKIHHHAPTVEDVLREFACVGIHIAAEEGMRAGEFSFSIDEEAIAEYAAKLTLRGDE